MICFYKDRVIHSFGGGWVCFALMPNAFKRLTHVTDAIDSFEWLAGHADATQYAVLEVS